MRVPVGPIRATPVMATPRTPCIAPGTMVCVVLWPILCLSSGLLSLWASVARILCRGFTILLFGARVACILCLGFIFLLFWARAARILCNGFNFFLVLKGFGRGLRFGFFGFLGLCFSGFALHGRLGQLHSLCSWQINLGGKGFVLCEWFNCRTPC